MEESIGLGDIVSFGWKDGYANATVCKVHANGNVDVLRPYIHDGKVTSSSQDGSKQTILYIGTEQVSNLNPKALTLLKKKA